MSGKEEGFLVRVGLGVGIAGLYCHSLSEHHIECRPEVEIRCLVAEVGSARGGGYRVWALRHGDWRTIWCLRLERRPDTLSVEG
jgi:hypothetical protein